MSSLAPETPSTSPPAPTPVSSPPTSSPPASTPVSSLQASNPETPYTSPPTPETTSTFSPGPIDPSTSFLPAPARTSIGLIAAIVIFGTIVLVPVIIFVTLRSIRNATPPQGPKDIPSNRRPKYLRSNAPPPTENGIAIRMEPTTQPNIAPGPMKFTYEELVTATNGFSTANFLGRGGFGDVHKGVLPSGKQVAVKQLKAGSMQGVREFQAEVEIISRVHHKHLVSLVGYCINGTQMMLAYEYVPNNTLKFHLHGKEGPTMSWETRMKIALGSAKGLAYLHDDCEPNIIHRDIKADNILLDYNFVAKVADFGLAKCFPDDDTHVSTQIKGTFGYLAPEYARSGWLTDKSDVFSFGVVLLELITGHRPIYQTQSFEAESLVEWARPLLKQALEGGNFDALVDPRLQGYNSSEMARMVACADACIRQSGVLRPRMSQIFQALDGNINPLDNLNEGIKPGDSTIYDQDGSSDYGTSQYTEDLNFNKTALQSQEQSTSEIRVHTS